MVRRGDPDRFLSAMTAPEPGRSRLMALYAFNLELARAPFVVSEPMLARIRLQWWREAVEEARVGAPRRHEVAAPLARAFEDSAAPPALVERLIAGWERAADGPPAGADVAPFLRETGAPLLALAARMLASEGADAVAEDAGFAFAVANWLRAIPALTARGARTPERGAVEALARDGLAALGAARAGRRAAPEAALPAFLAGWRAEHALRAACARAFDPASGPRETSPFRSRAALLWAATTGRW